MSQGSMIAITGSEGLIGRSLSASLSKLGYSILKIDQRLDTSFTGHGNICDKNWLSTILNSCCGIVHLAAVSRVVWGELEPDLCWQVNVHGTQNILEAASHSASKPWVIYASSREVYGQQPILPVTEDAELMPMNHYARSKVAAENLINKFRADGLRAAILRFSSVYGDSDDHPDRVIPTFCLNAMQGKSLRIDGFQNTFDFTHVSDVTRGIIKTIDLINETANYPPAIHFTTGHGTALLEVAGLIQKIINKQVHYHEAPPRNYDVHTFYGNSILAKKWLGWETRVDLESGLKDLISQYQHSMKKEILL